MRKFERRPRSMCLLLIGVFLVGGLIPLEVVVAQEVLGTSPPNAQTVLKSRFILWDPTEKMMDNNFEVCMYAWENTTHNYTIRIDNNEYEGKFYYYHSVNFTYNNSYIGELRVYIDGNLTFSGDNIIIMEGITGGRIRHFIETYKIEFLPFELTAFQWNLFWSGIVATLICLPTAYYTVVYYRRNIGARRV